MLFVGIDPGKSGGLAVVDREGNPMAATAMPETERELFEWLAGFAHGACITGDTRAVLERVHSSPGMGVKSVFTFGMSYGALRMALAAADIPYDSVTPQRWQAVVGVRYPAATKTESGGHFKAKDKNIPKRRAQELFPTWKVTHAVADALLLAEYCRRIHLGLALSAVGQTEAF